MHTRYSENDISGCVLVTKYVSFLVHQDFCDISDVDISVVRLKTRTKSLKKIDFFAYSHWL